MNAKRPYRSVPVALAMGLVLAGGALTACSFSASTGVSKSDLETKSMEILTTANPDMTVESVTCPDGLDAEVGSSTSCDVVSSNGNLTITVAVEKVEDGVINWTITAIDPAE